MRVLESFSPDLFKGKVAFITGGGSGINLGIAKVLASLGASIGICGRTSAKLEAAALELAEYRSQVDWSVADVRDPAALEAALAKVEQRLGRIDILVCGAAGNFLAPAEALSPNGFKTVIDIDLLGSFNTARLALPYLKKTGGSIIFISAGQSYVPYAYQVHASAAKAGIDQMMRVLALEWGQYGIRVNSVVPGPIANTEGLQKLSTPQQLERLTQAIALRRLGSVEEIGHCVAFLASPLAAFVTGTQLVCDGGQNLAGSGILTIGLEQMLPPPVASKPA